MIPKFTDEWLRITTGKFRGWQGRLMKSDTEEDNGTNYYTMFPNFKNTRNGKIYSDTIGLGLIINIPENHLTEVKNESG